MINLFFLIASLLLAIYLYYTYIFYKGLKSPHNLHNFTRPFVSVIIAARNEEKNMPKLLTYMINQSYPSDRYEIIIADDGSTDKTEEIVKNFKKNHENLHYIKIDDRENYISAKKNALQNAIEKSSGELLLFTDADCFVGKYWISSMVENFEKDVDMVCGLSQTIANKWENIGFIQKFEHFDFLVMFFAAAGAISSGKYFSCSGQNIAYRKSAFKEIDGFSKIMHIQSGDDVNLLQLFRKAGKKVVFSFNNLSFVYTQPIKSFFDLINQRSRWASNFKYQLTLNPEFFVYLSIVFLVTYLPLILLFYNFYAGLTLFLLKFFADFFFTKKAFNLFEIEKKRMSFFVLWYFFYPIYIFIVTFFGLFEIFKWKR